MNTLFPRPRGLALFCGLALFTFLPGVASAADTTCALPRSTPEAQGMKPDAIERFIAEITSPRIGGIHSFMLVRHGHVVVERWWAPHTAEIPHPMYSLTKSFVSTAVGFAIAEGKLNLDDPVLKFFPDDAPTRPSAALSALTVRDLLRMATGHDWEKSEALTRTGKLPRNFAKKFLALPFDYQPGEKFRYESSASHLLSLIVERTTGQTTQAYLQSRLFEPLGIASPPWDKSPEGATVGCYGLQVRTEDLAKFGQLYLQKGRWGERQLLPASWVEAATSKQIEIIKPNGDPDWIQGYGYQFWICRYGFYRADGARGQFCIVMPQHDAVVVLTADTKDMRKLLQAVWDHLLPAFGSF